MTQINVIDGDIANVKAQTLITAINPVGYWDGAIDNVITRVAGGMFHGQAQAAMPLADGQLVWAKKTGPHVGAFEDVLFVVDDLKTKQYRVVSNALRAAAYREIPSVSLPLIRTGNQAGSYELREHALSQFALAVQDFADDPGVAIGEINVVVYHNSRDYEYLLRAFAHV